MEKNERDHRLAEEEYTKKVFIDRAIRDESMDAFDESVVRAILAPNKLLKTDSEMYSRVEGLVSCGHLDNETAASIGMDIGWDACSQNKSTKSVLLGYLNSLYSLRCVRRLTLGDTNHGDAEIAAVTAFTKLTVAEYLHDTLNLEKLIGVVGESLDKMIATGDDVQVAAFTRMRLDLDGLEHRLIGVDEAANVAGKYDAESHAGGLDYESVLATANMLTKEVMENRKYGTKSAYIHASVGGSWIYYDGEDWTRMKCGPNDTTGQFANVAAVAAYSPYRDFDDLRFKVRTNEHGDIEHTGDISDKVQTLIYIGKDGVLSFDPDGLDDIRYNMQATPMQEARLRAEVVSNFYDLSMPGGVRRVSPGEGSVLDRDDPDLDPIQDLLIPRVKTIGSHDNADDDIIRTVRGHSVVWFVRSLPNGYRATPDAVAAARKYGVVLKDGETFVRPHSRGAQDGILGHHAKRRSGES